MTEAICKYCNRVFSGMNEKQAETNLAIHQLSQHPDKVQLTEVKKK